MSKLASIEIVWFKRDLRVQDHAALTGALQSVKNNSAGLFPLYIMEPNAWQQPDASYRQWQFVVDCLQTLNHDLTAIGQPLQLIVGDAIEVLNLLRQRYIISQLWSHQETGNAWSYQRDEAVKQWCDQHQVTWQQPIQQPIKRGYLNRDEYGQFSHQFFKLPVLPAPDKGLLTPFFTEHSFNLKAINDAGLSPTFWVNEQTQRGGRHRAEKALNSFLSNRSQRYLQTIAKPLLAPQFSSRLSPHLAWGSLSIREVIQAAEQAMQVSSPSFNRRNLQAFYQRLHWQSHFMQKLETEPNIEFEAMHPLFNDLRPWNTQAQTHFENWKQGKTGYPLVDACMRCLTQTGWLPFRMRAMIMSFASYQLWIPWQKTAPYLASLFTDYEPGIHYSQVQMQSGVTGINQMRVYNPVKQSHDQDPNGQFIKRWCPELAALQGDELHAPWLANSELFAGNITLGKDYPLPIVDNAESSRCAKQTLNEVRKKVASKTLSQAVFIKHGSRKKPPNPRKTSKKSTKPTASDQQLTLF